MPQVVLYILRFCFSHFVFAQISIYIKLALHLQVSGLQVQKLHVLQVNLIIMYRLLLSILTNHLSVDIF